MVNSFPEILNPTFQFGVYFYTLGGIRRVIKILNPSIESVSYDIFRQIWLLAFSQPFLFLAIPLDLCYAQKLTVRGLKLRLRTCYRYYFRT